MDVKDLSTTPVKLPDGKEASLLELVDDWADRVLRLEEKAQSAAFDTDLKGIRQFVAALKVRDRLEEALAANKIPGVRRLRRS